MPKPNYAFENRQRELAKKQKKEEKLLKRSSQNPAGVEGEAVDEAQSEPAPPQNGPASP
jgi:hypothetical protein